MMRPPHTRRGLIFVTLCGCWCATLLGALTTATELKRMMHHKNHKSTKDTARDLASFFCAFCLFVFFVVHHSLEVYSHHRPQNPPTSAHTTSQAPRQPVTPTASSFSTGTITGRIMTDDGQPVPHAPVFAMSSGFGSQVANTDEQGRFQFTGLPAVSYFINTTVPGYVSSSLIERAAGDGSGRVYYHLGDVVTLTVIKGGVMTGRVTDASGEAITGLAVRAFPMRDADGKPLFSSPALTQDGQTDDRGIYRIYGLMPGSYLVGTTNRPSRSSGLPPRVGQAPTYHPASTSDTAAEVTVHRGEEASGIDIRFRGERCYAVSGTVVQTAAASAAPPEMPVQISLYNLATRAIEAGATIQPSNGKYAFALYGVPDGEYEFVAKGMISNEDEVAALARRVLVKGADVTGIELTLAPLSSISGRIVLEPSSSEVRPGCEIKRPSRLEEINLTARLAEKVNRDESVSSWHQVTANAVPDGKGEFTLRNLTPGRYRLATNLPNEHWYIKSITAPNPAAARQTVDAGRNGLALKAGEKAKGLTITIAEGAASVRGRVTPAVEGAKLPARLRVHLIPAEPAVADDVLRYAQTTARRDGSFTFVNLAPGKYWLLARPIEDDESPESADRPAAWDQAARAKLRRAAESAKVEIELQPCQRVNDYALRYAPSSSNR